MSTREKIFAAIVVIFFVCLIVRLSTVTEHDKYHAIKAQLKSSTEDIT